MIYIAVFVCALSGLYISFNKIPTFVIRIKGFKKHKIEFKVFKFF